MPPRHRPVTSKIRIRNHKISATEKQQNFRRNQQRPHVRARCRYVSPSFPIPCPRRGIAYQLRVQFWEEARKNRPAFCRKAAYPRIKKGQTLFVTDTFRYIGPRGHRVPTCSKRVRHFELIAFEGSLLGLRIAQKGSDTLCWLRLRVH